MRRLRPLLPHAVILIANMYIVFFLIDRVNPAMNFIDNGLTKGLLVILCLAAVYNASMLTRRSAPRPTPPRQRPRRYGDDYRYDRQPRRYDDRYRRYDERRTPPRRSLYNEEFDRRYDRYDPRGE